MYYGGRKVKMVIAIIYNDNIIFIIFEIFI